MMDQERINIYWKLTLSQEWWWTFYVQLLWNLSSWMKYAFSLKMRKLVTQRAWESRSGPMATCWPVWDCAISRNAILQQKHIYIVTPDTNYKILLHLTNLDINWQHYT